MKITAVTPLVLGTAWRELIFLRVDTDEGLTGYGEVRPLNKTEAVLGYLREAAPRYLLGRDPFDTERLVHEMMHGDFGRPGEIAMSALALMEVACWDLKGKALNQPVYRLLGGAVRDRIKLYANGWYRVDRTPAAFAGAARAAVARGYRALKFDPFGNHGFDDFPTAALRLSVDLVAAVRDAVGPDVDLLIEMHGRFTPAGAIAMARDLAPFRPGWFEEPVPPENLAALQRAYAGMAPLGIPIAVGERIHSPVDVQPLFQLGACDILQTDLTHFGGLANTRKIMAQAEYHYLRGAPHNVGGPVSTAAALHLAACTPNFMIQENFNDFDAPHVMAAAPGLDLTLGADGCVPLPTGPGLGVTVDTDLIAAHPSRRVHFNLFADNWQKRDTAGPDAPGDSKASDPIL